MTVRKPYFTKMTMPKIKFLGQCIHWHTFTHRQTIWKPYLTAYAGGKKSLYFGILTEHSSDGMKYFTTPEYKLFARVQILYFMYLAAYPWVRVLKQKEWYCWHQIVEIEHCDKLFKILFVDDFPNLFCFTFSYQCTWTWFY